MSPPWNTVYRGGVPVAFIDWDPARPVEPLLELADAAWCFVPLDETRGAGSRILDPVRRGRRLRCSSTPMGRERIAVVRAIERSVRRRADLLRFWDLDEKGEADFLESINRDSRGWGRSRRSSSELWREAVGRHLDRHTIEMMAASR